MICSSLNRCLFMPSPPAITATRKTRLPPGPIRGEKLIAAAGFPMACLETRHAKAALSAMVVKTDRNDARGIAQIVWAVPPQTCM